MTMLMLAQAQAEGWKLHTAVAWRGGMDVDIKGGQSYTGDNPWNRSSGSSETDFVWDDDDTTYTPIAPSTSGTYSDGYMKATTAFTFNKASPAYGMTWNWGYDDNAQYDAANLTLTLTRQINGTLIGSDRTGTKQRTVVDVNNTVMPGDADEDFTAIGAEIGVEREIIKNDQWSLGLLLCVAGFDPQSVNQSETVWQGQMTENSYETTRVESDFSAYATYTQTSVFGDPNNSVLPGNPAPYYGTDAGPGPPINYNASSSTYTTIGTPQPTSAGTVTESTRLVSTRTWQGVSGVDYDMDLDHYAFRIGPTINWQIDFITLAFQPWLSLNYIDLTATRTETLTITDPNGIASAQRWQDKNSDEQWIFGGGMKASVNVFITDQIFCGINAGYDWLSQDAENAVGPSQISVDISGYELGLALGFRH